MPVDDPLAHRLAVGALGQRRHGVRLVVEREVPEAVLGVRAEHVGHGLLHDGGHLVGERGVVDEGGRVGGGQQGRLPVIVLQALAHERGAPGGAAGQDAAAAHVAQRPGQVAHPLEAEHGIEEVDGHHRLAPGGVGGGQRDEAGQRAGLGDALLEHLPRGALGVVERQVGVDRDVVLPVGRVDLRLGDERLQPEGAGLVRDDGRHQRAHGGVAHEVAQQAGEHHGGRDRLLARPGGELLEDLGVGPQRRAWAGPRGPGAGRRGRGPGPAGTPWRRSPRRAGCRAGRPRARRRGCRRSCRGGRAGRAPAPWSSS